MDARGATFERFNQFAEFLAGPDTLLLRVRSEIGDLGVGDCAIEQSAKSLSPIVRALAEFKVCAMCEDARIAAVNGIVDMARSTIVGG